MTKFAGQTVTKFRHLTLSVNGYEHTHRGGVDQKAAANTSDGETDELGGHDEHPLI
jgi:hypothetical protein